MLRDSHFLLEHAPLGCKGILIWLHILFVGKLDFDFGHEFLCLWDLYSRIPDIICHKPLEYSPLAFEIDMHTILHGI
jgi:hypothetical protein